MDRSSATPKVTPHELEAYFARVGYDGPKVPTRSVLDALVYAHLTHIPFENLDVRLGREISLSSVDVFRKLVTNRRGGYCFEHNGLFAEVLAALGFEVTGLSARVRIDRARSFVSPRTHLFNRVELEGRTFLVDVGVGALSPTCALELVLDAEQPTPHEARRIIAEGDWDGFFRRSPDARLFHQVRLGDAWCDVCEFTLEPMHSIDCELANWFTSMSPRSHFRDRVMVALVTATGRLTLLNQELRSRTNDGRAEAQTLTTASQMKDVLKSRFGMELTTDEVVLISGLPR